MRKSFIGLTFALAAIASEPTQGHAAVFGEARAVRLDSSVIAAQYWRGGPHHGWRGRPYRHADRRGCCFGYPDHGGRRRGRSTPSGAGSMLVLGGPLPQ
jgi:hypothetical protein